MKVFIVCFRDYEDNGILGVYTDQDAANARLAEVKALREVEHRKMYGGPIPMYGKPYFKPEIVVFTANEPIEEEF